MLGARIRVVGDPEKPVVVAPDRTGQSTPIWGAEPVTYRSTSTPIRGLLRPAEGLPHSSGRRLWGRSETRTPNALFRRPEDTSKHVPIDAVESDAGDPPDARGDHLEAVPITALNRPTRATKPGSLKDLEQDAQGAETTPIEATEPDRIRASNESDHGAATMPSPPHAGARRTPRSQPDHRVGTDPRAAPNVSA
jgi:hypothetical protein